MKSSCALLATATLLALAAGSAGPAPLPARGAAPAVQAGGDVVLSWNDLGMHCMNRDHLNFSILPPFNNLYAQVIRRGDAVQSPQLLTAGLTLEYSVPGNTYSVGKTDFWTYAPALFGTNLPPDVGLTGKGLSGTLDPAGSHFVAIGIPVTPWPDADLVMEHPFQQALVIARDAGGNELGRSTPVIPVSTELHCVYPGCHASESAILNSHESVTGFDPNVRPILCAGCHADPALGTTGRPDAGYFSFRIHDQHKFMDETMSGTALCYRCHPGPVTGCLRGAMRVQHGLECQNCHGGMTEMAYGIEHGRIPWAEEPRCNDCHTAQYAENPGTLFRNSVGHGGVMCEGCHNSTHADVPSARAEDNANNIALQGHAGPIDDCTVCHGVNPAGAGPHGRTVVGVGDELLAGARPLVVSPNPMRAGCAIDLPAAGGRLIVYDARGRIVRMFAPAADGGAAPTRLAWDGRDHRGARVQPGAYFLRWQGAGASAAAARLTVVR